MKKIFQSASLFLLACFFHAPIMCAVQLKPNIKSKFSQKIVSSLFRFVAFKEIHAFFPTKTSRVAPIVALLLPLTAFFIKIYRLKKQTFPPGVSIEKNTETNEWELCLGDTKMQKKSKEINDFLNEVTTLTKKLGKKRRVNKELEEAHEALKTMHKELETAQKALEATYEEIEITNKELEAENRELRLKLSTLRSEHNEEKRILKQQKADLKVLVIALQGHAQKTIQKEESNKYSGIVVKKQDKIQMRIDTQANAQETSVKKSVRVENMMDAGTEEHNDTVAHKYKIISTTPDRCVFQYSTKTSGQYAEYKNYLFIIDQKTKDTIIQTLKNEQKTLQKSCKYHAHSCFSCLNPQDGTLYTFAYIAVLPEYCTGIKDMTLFLPIDKTRFDLISFFGESITPETIATAFNDLKEPLKTTLCLADIGKQTRKWVKKNNITQRFKQCFNLRPNTKNTFFPNVINVALEPLLPSECTYDTIAVASFLRFNTLYYRKICAKENEIIQFCNYQYTYTKEHGYFQYNVDTEKKPYALAVFIAKSIKTFSDNPIEFTQTNLYTALLANTQTVKTAREHKNQLAREDCHTIFKDAIPASETLTQLSESVKALIKQ